MDHVAIMTKSWGFMEKILTREKTIESRWYASRRSPWNTVHTGDTVYFKNSGEPIALRARVGKVIQFSGLVPAGVKKILKKHGQKDGIAQKDIPFFFNRFKDKKYCILIFLRDPARVAPFAVSKVGFGAMAAWISVPRISGIRCVR
jgi:hypothetical protein